MQYIFERIREFLIGLLSYSDKSTLPFQLFMLFYLLTFIHLKIVFWGYHPNFYKSKLAFYKQLMALFLINIWNSPG